ncbi:MAG: RluA family pseudouridine synthase [Acidobacteriota bacterium]
MGSLADTNQLIQAADQDRRKRLDRFLCERLPEKSRAQIQRLIHDGHVRVGGRVEKAAYRLRGDESIQVDWISEPPSQLLPEAIPLQIVYEDEDLVVIEKPAGLVVHVGAGVKSGTLVNALLYHFQNLSQAGGSDRPGIVHRLDKFTSGLIVIARNDRTHQALSRQFQSRSVFKGYLALVHGRVSREKGEVTSPIGRDLRQRLRMSTRAPRGRTAFTVYQVLERFPSFTLLKVQIKTGRTHQIRVHLSALRHPIVGDTLYGAPARIRLGKVTLPPLGRPFLHACELQFNHPRTDQRMDFRSRLPEELENFLAILRASESGECD